jgi:predicted transcriptional regulator
MTVFDTRKHSNIKRHPRYRRINRYTKSRVQYKKEALRRKQALEMQDQGVPNKEIALKLGVSERTVQRILEKPKSYIQRSRKHLRRYENTETLKGLTGEVSTESLSVKKQLELVRELNNRWGKNRKVKPCKDLTITIDAEAAVNNRYALRFKPCLPVEIQPNSKITIELELLGETQPLGRIYVTQLFEKQLIFETNQSLNVVIKPTLTRLKQFIDEAKRCNSS